MNKKRHLISKYLGGEMDPLSAARFEEDLQKDTELRKELELYREVDEALADTEVMELRMQLEEMHNQNSTERKKSLTPRVHRTALLSVAASLSALVIISALSIFRHNDREIVQAKYYRPYEITSTNRSAGSGTDKELRIALEKYQNKEYREALMLFEKVLETDPDEMATQLYSGISYFEIEEFTKAGRSFSKVIEHNDNLYIEQAKWYLGFCYLKTDEKDKAILQFTEIAESKSYYSEKAGKILRKLK